MDKVARYGKLVEKRRSCTDCIALSVRTLQSCDENKFGSQHIGPWTDWQGNLDAELMVVGQEWGGERNYSSQSGRDLDEDETNKNLVTLVNSISEPLGYHRLEPPSKYQCQEPVFKKPHYFTNALLCLRIGGATRKKGNAQPPQSSCYRSCCKKFLKGQVEIVRPRAVVTLGAEAYKGAAKAYGLKPAPNMAAAVAQGPVRLTSDTVLVPMFHPGYWGWRTRNKQNPSQQLEDWQRVKNFLVQTRTKY